MEGAAQEGCHLCHLLLETLTKAERQDLEGCEKIACGYWKVGLDGGIAFDFYYPLLGTQSNDYLTKSTLMQPEKGLLFQVLSTIGELTRFRNGGKIPQSQILDYAVQ